MNYSDSDVNRLLSKIRKTKTCWEFTGALRSGYGVLKINKKGISTHRLAYELHFGKIPDGILVCHKCDNKRCVNPNHLFLGTYQDNSKDAYRKGRVIVPIGRMFKKGDYPPNASYKLSKALQVKEAVLNKGSSTLKEISQRFNVNYQFVRDISSGRILKNYH